MYNVVKLSPMSREFVGKLRPSPLLNIAAAKAIANKLPLPSFEVEDVVGYYNQSVRTTANTFVSQLNEVVYLNSNEVSELVASFWKARYLTANPLNNILVVNQNVIHFFMGYGSSIAHDVIKTIESNGQEAIIMLRGLCVVIDELNKPQEQPEVSVVTESFSRKKRSVAHEGIMDFVKSLFGKKKEEQKPKEKMKTSKELISEIESLTFTEDRTVKLSKRVYGDIKNERELINFFKEVVNLFSKRIEIFEQFVTHANAAAVVYAPTTDQEYSEELYDTTSSKIYALTRKLVKQLKSKKYLPVSAVNDDLKLNVKTTSGSGCLVVDPSSFHLTCFFSYDDKSDFTINVSSTTLSEIKGLVIEILKSEDLCDAFIEKHEIGDANWDKLSDYIDETSDEDNDLIEDIYSLERLPRQNLYDIFYTGEETVKQFIAPLIQLDK